MGITHLLYIYFVNHPLIYIDSYYYIHIQSNDIETTERMNVVRVTPITAELLISLHVHVFNSDTCLYLCGIVITQYGSTGYIGMALVFQH